MSRDIDDIRSHLLDESAEIRRRAVLELREIPADDATALILTALGDDDWRVRKEAAALAAARANDKALVERLLEAVGEEDNIGLKNAAREALANAGETVEDEVAKRLQSPNPETRKNAIDIIGALKTQHAVKLLSSALDDENLNVRASAVEMLGDQENEQAAAPLLECLKAPHALLRIAALQSLRKLDVRVSWEHLKPLLRDSMLREELLFALGHSGEAKAAPEIAKYLPEEPSACLAMETLHGDSETTARAVKQALSNLPKAASAALREMTRSDDIALSRAALRCLLRSGAVENIASIVSLTRNSRLYSSLVEGLAEWGKPAINALCDLLTVEKDERLAGVIGLLSRLLDDETGRTVAKDFARHLLSEHPAVCTAAANATARFGDETTALSLMRLLSSDSPRTRSAAGFALTEIGRRYPDAVRAASSKTPLQGPVGIQMCRVLETVGKEDDFERLASAANDEPPELRRAALRAATIVGKSRALAQIEKALADTDLSVRIAAADATALIGDDARELIVKALETAEGPVVAALMRAFGKVGHPRAEEILSGMCRKSSDVILCALKASAALDAPPFSMKKELLEHSDQEVVKAALDAFGKTMTVAELTNFLSHRSWDLRLKAAEALGAEIDKQGVEKILEDRLHKDDNDLVSDAIKAMLAGKREKDT